MNIIANPSAKICRWGSVDQGESSRILTHRAPHPPTFPDLSPTAFLLADSFIDELLADK